MKTIDMGLNTEPAWIGADKVIERWKGNQEMIDRWIREKDHSISLRDEIIRVVESDGECSLSWSCTGRTRHAMHAHQWSDAMPQYDFQIGYNYECIVRKKVE